MSFLPMSIRIARVPFFLTLAAVLVAGCSRDQTKPAVRIPAEQPKVSYFHVDPSTAATLTGTVRFKGHKPAPQPIDMSDDPACVHAHHGKPYDQSLLVGPQNTLGNVFVYVEKGLEGKNFEIPSAPAVIDQTGCWFVPRVLGIQVGQTLKVIRMGRRIGNGTTAKALGTRRSSATSLNRRSWCR
jgi:hypothetical protein